MILEAVAGNEIFNNSFAAYFDSYFLSNNHERQFFLVFFEAMKYKYNV